MTVLYKYKTYRHDRVGVSTAKGGVYHKKQRAGYKKQIEGCFSVPAPQLSSPWQVVNFCHMSAEARINVSDLPARRLLSLGHRALTLPVDNDANASMI